jgi:hypothetical protein
MKNKITARVAFFLTAVLLFASCGKSYIEENQDAYKATDVVPVVFSVTGPTSVYQTEVRDYVINYSRSGSTWAWSVTNATLTGVSADTKTATVTFGTKPANDTVYISVTETTSAGVSSPTKVIKAKVNPFCTLDINNFVGTFDCDEEGYGVYTVHLTRHPTLANTIRNDNFWDWAAADAYVNYTLSGNFLETVTVPKQTFEYGDGTIGWVQGSGKYDGCAHTMVVDYVNEYGGDEYETHHEFSPGSKGVMTVVKRRNSSMIK